MRSFLFVNLYLIILFGVISFALFLFFTLISKNKWGILASIFVLTFSIGIFRFHIAYVPVPEIFESKIGGKETFQGEIIEEPDRREDNQKLTVGVRVGEEKTKILISTSLDREYKYGDEVDFMGKLEKPENFITDRGKEFDYINYLRKDGIFFLMSYPEIETIATGNGNKIKSALFIVKEKFLEKMNLAIRSPESLLMGGLILGEKATFNC